MQRSVDYGLEGVRVGLGYGWAIYSVGFGMGWGLVALTICLLFVYLVKVSSK